MGVVENEGKPVQVFKTELTIGKTVTAVAQLVEQGTRVLFPDGGSNPLGSFLEWRKKIQDIQNIKRLIDNRARLAIRVKIGIVNCRRSLYCFIRAYDAVWSL